MIRAGVFIVSAVVVSAAGVAMGSTPWATEVIGFNQGSGANPDFGNPLAVLGQPTRFTAPDSQWGGPTTPFQAAFGVDEFFSIGEGGFVTVRFDRPIVNNPANPFGIDFLVFGNSFYFDVAFPDGVAGPLSADGGIIEVSQDGDLWHTIPGVDADGKFPTLGYSDVTEPFPTSAGSILTDFTKPVDPSFDPTGKTLAEIIAGYDGSGGGVGVDLSVVGLYSIQFVRISNPVGSGKTVEIDAFSIVIPAPGSVLAFALGGLLVSRRRRSLEA